MKRVIWVLLAVLGAAAIVYTFMPRAVEVDVAHADRGPMKVTVNEEGETRVKERYVISAPLTGDLRRIALEEGDAVSAGQTVLAMIDPTPPALLDVRQREQAEAQVRAAEAQLARAEPAITSAQAELEQAIREAQRATELETRQAATLEEAERARVAVITRRAELQSAESALDVARFQLEQARAALRVATTAPSATPQPFTIIAPIDGQVLEVLQESAAPVTAGTELLQVGDIRALEAVVDVLSRDAVQIQTGAQTTFERWGGGEPIEGLVRRVEPSGFTKISALGVEEQRVNVIIDFDNIDSAGRPILGDDYRVDARIVTWQRPDVLKVPTGALFREGEAWAVFAIENQRAALIRPRIGQINDLEAEVLEGLRAGQPVILYPSDKVRDGSRVQPRQ